MSSQRNRGITSDSSSCPDWLKQARGAIEIICQCLASVLKVEFPPRIAISPITPTQTGRRGAKYVKNGRPVMHSTAVFCVHLVY